MVFKKKPIYIVGIVLFTLLLIADLAVFFLLPSGGRGNMPGGMGGSFNGQRPEGFDSENFDPEGFGGQRPERGEDFTMPEGVDGSNTPEGFDSSNMPEGFDSSNMPEGFDGSGMPNRGQMGGPAGGGFLSAIRSAFWPILIVCVLGDALCIFMLIRISGKKAKEQEDNDEDHDDDHDDDTPPRRDRTNITLAIVALLLVGAVVLSSLSSGGTGSALEAQMSVQSTVAGMNDIVNLFSGSGTLLSSDAVETELPLSVKVTSYTVKNGDSVQAGDIIANVDKTSVLKAIYEVQSLITKMDAEIAEVRSDTLDEKVTARAAGRVKAIYVSEGDSVAGSMYENGAIILISLGGSMTVVIESEKELTVGQTLTVTLSDKTKIEGKVQQVQDGKITVTTTDNGPAPDDTVTVVAEDGTKLGTGTLSISSPLKVTGFFGTVDKIAVKVGDKVKTGDTLLTLKNTEDLARYQQLLRQRQELTGMVSELSAIYQDGTIKAAASGVISQIDEDAVYAQLSAAASTGYYAAPLSASSGSYGIRLLSNTEPGTNPPAGGATPPVQTQTDGTFAGLVTKVTYGALQIKISETDMTGSTIAAVETMDEALFTAEKQYAPDLTVPVNLYQNGQTMHCGSPLVQTPGKKAKKFCSDACRMKWWAEHSEQLDRTMHTNKCA